MSNRNFCAIGALGIAVPAENILMLELKFNASSSHTLILPTRSIDPIQVARKQSLSYAVYAHYNNPITEEKEVGELACGDLDVGLTITPLIESFAYKGLNDKARTNTDKAARNIIRFMRKKERISTAQPDNMQVPDPNAATDLPTVLDEENTISAEEELAQLMRITKMETRINGFVEETVVDLSVAQAIEIIRSGSSDDPDLNVDALLEPATDALAYQAKLIDGRYDGSDT
jgi:hypothetical protein